MNSKMTWKYNPISGCYVADGGWFWCEVVRKTNRDWYWCVVVIISETESMEYKKVVESKLTGLKTMREAKEMAERVLNNVLKEGKENE